MSQKITPCLWFEKDAHEICKFYTSIFKGSEVKNIRTLRNTPSGTAEVAAVRLRDMESTLLVAGPFFKFTPAVSFLVACETKGETEELWNKLSEGGRPLMELGEYPFSEKYGWTEDKYGLSWQVMFMGGHAIEQQITPSLLFVGWQCGKAEEAMEFYSTMFNESRIDGIVRYGEGDSPDRAGTVKHAAFTLAGRRFTAMDSAYPHAFTFNEAISFMVHCETQEEIDYYWGKLSADPAAEQCGWLKDKYGLSWQVVPTVLGEILKDKEKSARVTAAFLKMKKFDIEALKQAYEGN
ncbi:MAG: VOC family protein [Terriglobia bacterium]|jgi:predicted 3-demethylubiquinone-9 3-methyltransferase (glyoxalase superfamily)